MKIADQLFNCVTEKDKWNYFIVQLRKTNEITLLYNWERQMKLFYVVFVICGGLIYFKKTSTIYPYQT